jgi:hypothetical protein
MRDGNIFPPGLESSEKSRWVSQNFSKQKGLNLGVLVCQSRVALGQWSEPDFGRMFASIKGPSNINVSDMRNRSSLHMLPVERQTICWTR